MDIQLVVEPIGQRDIVAGLRQAVALITRFLIVSRPGCSRLVANHTLVPIAAGVHNDVRGGDGDGPLAFVNFGGFRVGAHRRAVLANLDRSGVFHSGFRAGDYFNGHGDGALSVFFHLRNYPLDHLGSRRIIGLCLTFIVRIHGNRRTVCHRLLSQLRPCWHHVGDGDVRLVGLGVLVEDGVGQLVSYFEASVRHCRRGVSRPRLILCDRLFGDVGFCLRGLFGSIVPYLDRCLIFNRVFFVLHCRFCHLYLEGNFVGGGGGGIVDCPGQGFGSVVIGRVHRAIFHILGSLGNGIRHGHRSRCRVSILIHRVVDPLDGIGQDVAHAGHFAVGVNPVRVLCCACCDRLGVSFFRNGVGELGRCRADFGYCVSLVIGCLCHGNFRLS